MIGTGFRVGLHDWLRGLVSVENKKKKQDTDWTIMDYGDELKHVLMREYAVTVSAYLMRSRTTLLSGPNHVQLFDDLCESVGGIESMSILEIRFAMEFAVGMEAVSLMRLKQEAGIPYDRGYCIWVMNSLCNIMADYRQLFFGRDDIPRCGELPIYLQRNPILHLPRKRAVATPKAEF